MALLELHDVNYQTDDRLILNQITLSVEKGDFLTITGPSGGGKSTLLRLIASLLTPTSGEILLMEKRSKPMTTLTIDSRYRIAINSPLYLEIR